MRKIIYISILLMACTYSLCAQESRSLPFLEFNPDTRSAGMGGATMGESKSMYLYTNPSSIFSNSSKYYASYTYGLLPKIEDNRQSFHAVSAGYKLFNNHSIMVGFRYLGGLSIPSFDMNGMQKKDIKPNDWSIDVSYAIKINERFSAYLGAGFIQSYIGKTAYTAGFSGGAYYKNTFDFMGDVAKYNVGFAFYDLGGKIKYGSKGTSNNIPSSVGIGGSVGLPFAKNHKLNAALATRYFMTPSDASSLGMSIGLEYELYDIAAIRTGYHLDSKYSTNNYFSLGLGCNIEFIYINISYDIMRNKDYNVLRLGLNFQL